MDLASTTDTPDPAREWRRWLPALEGLPLLPCGAGDEGKAPLDPATGELLTGWPTAAYTPQRIAALNGQVLCCGTRTGPDAHGLLAFDLDGETAITYCREHGCDPHAARTWQIVRNTDPHRLKVCWRLPPDLWEHIGAVKRKRITRPSPPGGKGEQVELFFGKGQILVLGYHRESGGYYYWPEDHTPAELSDIPPEWWELALLIAGGTTPQPITLAAADHPSLATTAADPVPLEQLLSREQEQLFRNGAGEGTRDDDTFRLAVGLLTAADGAAAAGLPVSADPERLVLDFAARCRPPFPEREALAKLASARSQPRQPDQNLSERLAYWLRSNSSGREQRTHGATPSPIAATRSSNARGHGEGTRQAIAVLQETMANGLGEVELQVLIQELSERHDTSPVALQKIAQSERDRLGASVEMEAARRAIEAERDRQELVSNLHLCDLLPTRAAKAAEALTRYLPADPLASALLVLGGFSGVLRLGSRINAYPATHFVEPLCLFAGIVATSGQKKSPLFRALVRNPVRQVTKEIRAAYRLELEKWEALNSKQAESGSPPIPKPREGRAVTTGYTTEALMGQLAANQQPSLGLLVAMDELDGLFASENAYRGGRGADEQILLETYVGNGQEILRVRDDVDRRFDRCHVSIVGGIQPEVLAARVSEGDPRGKWARFCWAPIPRRVCPLPPCDGDGGFQAAAEELAAIYLQGHRISPETYRLDPAGRERFRAYEEQCQREALDAQSGAVRALRSKAAGKVARIAGVLHVLAIACDEAFGPVVDAQLIDRAILLVDFLDGWAAGLHQRRVGADGCSADALMRKIHQLSSARRAPITSREVWHRLSKAQRKSTDFALIEAAMAQLAHLGAGEVTVSDRGAHAYRATGGLPQ